MGRYVPNNLIGVTPNFTTNVAGPIANRLELQCGPYTDFPMFIPADLSGISLVYHVQNFNASSDTITMTPGTQWGNLGQEQLLGAALGSITNSIAFNATANFTFAFTSGLATYQGFGGADYWTSFTISGILATVDVSLNAYLQNLGGGFINTAPQQLTATPQPGYNLVSYAYAPPGLSFGSWNVPAGQTQNLYRGPSSAGPWTLVATGVTGPYRDYTVLNSWYQVSSVDPTAGESAARTTTAAAAMPLPVVGGGRSMARDMLTLGFFG